VNALLADDDLLKSVLLYHVLPSEVNSDLFHVYDTLDTLLQGNLLRVVDNKPLEDREFQGCTLCLRMFSFQ
jgi:hypothetical protein